MKIIKTKDNKAIAECFIIAKKLPDYFNERGFSLMSHDLKLHDLYIIRINNNIIGFISINNKSAYVAEISWFAVDPEYQNNGYGTKLINHISTEIKKEGKKILEVKTLDKIANYEPYERTRRFYEKNEFLHLETINPYPEWGEENPCAIYIKLLINF